MIIGKIKRFISGKYYYDEDDSWLECFDSLYCRIVPYNWRCRQIWYKLKGFCWHRYTTVKPRTINFHTWCDRDALLAHTMFEILVQFVEKECSPSNVEWYCIKGGDEFDPSCEKDEYPCCAKRIIPGEDFNYKKINDPKAVWVLDEMKELIRWWQEDFLPHEDNAHREWHDFCEEHQLPSAKFVAEESPEFGKVYPWDPQQFDTQENKKIANELFKKGTKKEEELHKQLRENLIRIINIKDMMWT